MTELKPKVRPKIGLMYTGLAAYWPQYPEFLEIGSNMYDKYIKRFREIGEVVEAKFVDTPEKSEEAGKMFAREGIDILFILPFGYTTGMIIVPCIERVAKNIPLRLLATHEDATYDYKNATTSQFLHHSGICCIPEYSGTLVRLKRKFRVITGWLEDGRFWTEIRRDSIGAAAAATFRMLKFAVIGSHYTNMTDMPADDHRQLKATGKLFLRPEVEEFEAEYGKVSEDEIRDMNRQFREFYDVDETVTDAHMYESTKIAAVYDKIIRRYDISGFGYYWWGVSELVTQLRAQSTLAGSRLASMGVPNVTEGDVKTAMAMKAMDLMGAGGMFIEYNTIDYENDFILISHDGPVNFNVSEGRPRLQHLEVHHGKTGQVGNPNGRLKVSKPIHQFVDEWCQQGPIHHSSLGIGDFSREIETFAQAMGFACVRI